MGNPPLMNKGLLESNPLILYRPYILLPIIAITIIIVIAIIIVVVVITTVVTIVLLLLLLLHALALRRQSADLGGTRKRWNLCICIAIAVCCVRALL